MHSRVWLFVTPGTVYSSPGSSVHGISQAILEWVTISSSRGFPDPGIEPVSPALAGGFFTAELPGNLIHTHTHTHTHTKIERKIRLLFYLWMEYKFLLGTAHFPHLGIWHWHPHALFQADFWAVCAFNTATAKNPALKMYDIITRGAVQANVEAVISLEAAAAAVFDKCAVLLCLPWLLRIFALPLTCCGNMGYLGTVWKLHWFLVRNTTAKCSGLLPFSFPSCLGNQNGIRNSLGLKVSKWDTKRLTDLPSLLFSNCSYNIEQSSTVCVCVCARLLYYFIWDLRSKG